MKFMIVSIKQIIVQPNRGRKAFTRIDELAESLKANGFINPILVTQSTVKEGHFDLIAGERRYRAAILAGLTQVPVTFKENLTLLQQKIIELEENVGRVDLDWQEEAELHNQINEAKQKDVPGWTQKATAELVNLSEGHVSDQIKMAKRLSAEPELRSLVKDKPFNVAKKLIEQHDQVVKADRLAAQGKLTITTDLRLGDCVKLIKELPTASVDMLLTDPPYGLEQLEALIDSSGSKMSGHQLMSKHHNSDLDSVLTMLRALAPELKRVMKPGAHGYVFTAFQYIGDFIKALEPLEFQPPVIVWDRGKPTTPGYGYNYLNRLEAIIMFHNPPRGRRLAKNMYNVLEHPEVPKNLRVYPTEKPQSLLKELIGQSSNLGELVLDPFSGSASTLKAARGMGRRSIGFEINPDSWKRAQLILSGQMTDGGQPEMFEDDKLKTAKMGV